MRMCSTCNGVAILYSKRFASFSLISLVLSDSNNKKRAHWFGRPSSSYMSSHRACRALGCSYIHTPHVHERTTGGPAACQPATGSSSWVTCSNPHISLIPVSDCEDKTSTLVLQRPSVPRHEYLCVPRMLNKFKYSNVHERSKQQVSRRARESKAEVVEAPSAVLFFVIFQMRIPRHALVRLSIPTEPHP
jgi:hypothetical protein